MDGTQAILIAAARVALPSPAELTRQFSPLAKTTAVESKILIAVARADLAIASAAPVIRAATAAAMIGGLLALVIYKHRRL